MLVLANKLEPTTPSARIPLNKELYCLVDPHWFDYLVLYNWYPKKSQYRYYACRKVTENGHTFFIRMHRLIAHTPLELVCHHINGNTLDNRRANLLNMSWFDHTKMYSYR